MSAAYPNPAKRQLADGKLALGMVLRQSRTVDVGAIAKRCGFDFLSIDLEHSSLNVDAAAQIAAAALPAGVAPIVRVPSTAAHDAARLLDAGAQGLIVPHVDTADDARAAVALAKYPPLGHRSVAATLPHVGFQRLTGEETARLVNTETLVVAMLETSAAVEAADDIAAVPGVDVLLVGTHDLCAELGIAGRLTDPLIEDAYRRVVAAAGRHGRHAGMAGVHDNDFVARLVELGVRFIVAGVDVNFLMAAAGARTSFLRGLLG